MRCFSLPFGIPWWSTFLSSLQGGPEHRGLGERGPTRRWSHRMGARCRLVSFPFPRPSTDRQLWTGRLCHCLAESTAPSRLWRQRHRSPWCRWRGRGRGGLEACGAGHLPWCGVACLLVPHGQHSCRVWGWQQGQRSRIVSHQYFLLAHHHLPSLLLTCAVGYY